MFQLIFLTIYSLHKRSYRFGTFGVVPGSGWNSFCFLFSSEIEVRRKNYKKPNESIAERDDRSILMFTEENASNMHLRGKNSNDWGIKQYPHWFLFKDYGIHNNSKIS